MQYMAMIHNPDDHSMGPEGLRPAASIQMQSAEQAVRRKPSGSWIMAQYINVVAMCGLVFWLGGQPSTVHAEDRRIPEGPLGVTIQLGRELVEKTTSHPMTKPYVGNSLNCTSCHLKNGTDIKAAPFIGVATAYPAWSPREKRVITLEDRVLNCFMRSCNGLRPPLGSEVSVSITAYITWLSADQPIRMNSERPVGPFAVPQLAVDTKQADRRRGAKLYEARCAACHADNGEGDEENPPVWGPMSFNDGAGLANVGKLASWLKVAMPLDETDLTDQEALDIAAFVNSHDRPVFRLGEHLPEKNKLGEYNSNVDR